MANTIREQIISAFVTRLAAWTTAGGFNYNCGASVFRAVKNIESEDLPAVVLWPQPETAERQYGRTVCAMQVKIEALAEIGSSNPSEIQEALLGDAIKIITAPAVSVTTKIEDIQYTGGGPADQPNAEDVTTAIYAEFEIKYSTLIGNPYSQ